jgi:predicted Zn-ribbon and HTH transcriptional regulator
MFRLEPHQLLYVYAALGVALVFAVAFLHNLARTRRERSAQLNVLKCGMCAFQFRNERQLVHPRCPNCGALVERKPISRL